MNIDMSALLLQAQKSLQGRAECLGILRCAGKAEAVSEQDIERALDFAFLPGGKRGPMLAGLKPAGPVCLVVSDHTRETSTDLVLPLLLRRLETIGCGPSDISVLVASGIHRPPGPAEIASILGAESAARLQGRIFIHDADNEAMLEEVGRTKRGNAVRLNKIYVNAALRIVVGAASYHYHAGFGGGRKSIVPGLAARATIAANHSLALDPELDRMHPAAAPGRMDGNPVAEEMMESARLCPPHAIVNTVVAPNHVLAGVFAGDMEAAHAAAVEAVRLHCGAGIEARADFALASAGGALNWIQAHKALVNACAAVKPNGRVILLADCSEGLGDERFRRWMRTKTMSELFAGLRKTPEVLGQTAFSTRTKGGRAILVSAMPAADAVDLGIETAPDIESALDRTLDILAREGVSRPMYYIMPEAKNLFPFPIAG